MMRFLNTMKVVALSGFFMAAGSAYAACDVSKVVEIDIRNMAFTPKDTTICVGQTVRWTNNEAATGPRVIRHTVTADPTKAAIPGNVVLPEGAEAFGSALLAPGQSFEQTFTVAGLYKYVCLPHERMGHVGSITVVEDDGAATELEN